MTNCTTIVCTIGKAVGSIFAVATPISVEVNTYAIGSLAPDSNSKSGRRLCLNEIPLVRMMENTDALSVDDIVAAISSAIGSVIVATALSQPKT